MPREFRVFEYVPSADYISEVTMYTYADVVLPFDQWNCEKCAQHATGIQSQS